MSAKPSPAASPSNDLAAMLANQTKIAETAEAERREAVRRVDFLKGVVKKLRQQRDDQATTVIELRVLLDLKDKTIEELEERVEFLEVNPVGSEEVRDLARVRTLLKNGNVDAARNGLERVLDGADSCWRQFA